jgi:hypothetical protein
MEQPAMKDAEAMENRKKRINVFAAARLSAGMDMIVLFGAIFRSTLDSMKRVL